MYVAFWHPLWTESVEDIQYPIVSSQENYPVIGDGVIPSLW